MTLSVQDALNHISHSLRSGGQMPGVGGIRILNDAGHSLVNMHAWQWLEGASVLLDFQANQDHVTLPRDFRDLVAYDITEGLTSGLSLATPAYIINLRTHSITTSTWRYWAKLGYKSTSEKASCTIALDSNPSGSSGEVVIAIDDAVHDQDNSWDGDSLTDKPGTQFSFVASAGTVVQTDDHREVVLGSSAALTAAALADAINAAPRLDVEASDDGANLITLTAKYAGRRGNDISVEDLDDLLTLSGVLGSNLTGGQDGSEPRARLDIYPTPTADSVGAVTIFYRAGWTNLVEDSETVVIPDWLESFYLQIVRAYARGYEIEDEATAVLRVDALRTSQTFRDLRERDSMMQPNYGPLMGGAATAAPQQTWFWNYNTVAGPS